MSTDATAIVLALFAVAAAVQAVAFRDRPVERRLYSLMVLALLVAVIVLMAR